MAYALIGTAGVVVQGAAGAAIAPAFGTGENRVAGNLLLLGVASNGSATLPAAIAGWTTVRQVAGTSCSASIYAKVAAGNDAAPTVPLVASAVHSGQLYEYSGNLSSGTTIQDQTAGSSGIATPIVATAAAADLTAGELVFAAGGALNSAARTHTITHTLNNGATATSTNNNATSTVNHYNFAYGVTTSQAAADSDSMAFVITQLTGAVVAVASFKLASLLPSQHHRRPPLVVAGISRGRF